MSSATIELDVSASANAVWSILRNFGEAGWIVLAQEVEVDGEGPGMTRRIHGTGEQPVVEELVSLDDDARELAYRITANNPLPVESYAGLVRVDETDDGARIVWSATFDVPGDEAEGIAVVEMMLGALTGWLADAAVA